MAERKSGGRPKNIGKLMTERKSGGGQKRLKSVP